MFRKNKANKAIAIQTDTSAQRSALNRRLIEHQYWSIVRQVAESCGKTYGCRRFVLLVEAITETNTEYNENTNKTNKAESKPTCFYPHRP
jgi:hypothetical protein